MMIKDNAGYEIFSWTEPPNWGAQAPPAPLVPTTSTLLELKCSVRSSLARSTSLHNMTLTEAALHYSTYT